MNLEEIAFTGDEENVGGVIHTEVWLIDYKKLTTIGAPPKMDADTPPATFDALMKVATAHVPVASEGFRKIEVIPKTGNIESVLSGEEKGKGYANSFTFQVLGNSTKALGLARWAANRDLVALVKEQGGQIRQFGSDVIPAMLQEATATTGGGGHDGSKHVAFTISDYQAYPAPVYDQAIPTPSA